MPDRFPQGFFDLEHIVFETETHQIKTDLDIFDPYRLFPILKGTETDLAAAVLRYLLVSELFGLVNGAVELP